MYCVYVYVECVYVCVCGENQYGNEIKPFGTTLILLAILTKRHWIETLIRKCTLK